MSAPMELTRFEKKVEDEIRVTERSAVRDIPAGDSHMFAVAKGKIEGLEFALGIYREERRKKDSEL